MTIVVIVLVIALVALAWVHFGQRLRRPARATATSTRRILFPFVGADLSPRALDAALRLAHAEGATLVPVFLARVPLQLPLDAPLPRQCDTALPLLEAIEQRARRFDVPVDGRIERGRTNRHALRQAIANERFDRIVVDASADANHGFDAADVAWLLGAAPGEIVILRPSKEERITPPSSRKRWAPRPRGDVHQASRARVGS
jgi:nucleotide-binding universal stress UspA family protein